VVATRKKSWRFDGQNPDRQRDWLGVSNVGLYFICIQAGGVFFVSAIVVLRSSILGRNIRR
jgi:hypothetical protein